MPLGYRYPRERVRRALSMLPSMHTHTRSHRNALLFSTPIGVLAVLPFICFLFSTACSTVSAEPGPHAKSDFQTLAHQADTARDAKEFTRAVSLYRRAVTLRPQWAEGWWALGTIFYEFDRYAEAADALQHVVHLIPKHGTARALLGLSEFELDDEVRALADLQASIELGMLEDVQLRHVVLYHDAVLLQRQGRFQSARTALSALCRAQVQSDDLLRTFGMTALLMRDKAAPSAGNLAETVHLVGHGACLAAQKDFDSARGDFESAVAHDPHAPNVHYAYGRFLLDARDRAAAIQQFELEIAQQPTDVNARLQIGAAEYKVDSAAALPYAEEAVQIAPGNPVAHYLLGLLLVDSGEYQKALPHLERARSAFSTDPDIYWSLAAVYDHNGRAAEAARARAAFVRLKRQSAANHTPASHLESDTASELHFKVTGDPAR